MGRGGRGIWVRLREGTENQGVNTTRKRLLTKAVFMVPTQGAPPWKQNQKASGWSQTVHGHTTRVWFA